MKIFILNLILFLIKFFSFGQTIEDTLYHYDNGEKIYLKKEVNYVQIMPTEKDLRTYINKQIIYPNKVKNNKTKGTVYASFIVEKNGEITDFKIVQGISKLCDKEVLRILTLLPKKGWTVAKKDGRKVRMQYILPVNFPIDYTN